MNDNNWTAIFYNLMAVVGMGALIMIALVVSVMVFHNQPVDFQLGGWNLAAAPSSFVSKIIKSQHEEKQSVNELEMVLVNNEVFSRLPDSPINNLYESVLDSLRGEEVFASNLPEGCINKYRDGDSAAIVFEFYLKCECSLKDLMNVLYMSIDVSEPDLPSIHKSILCEGIYRTGYPAFTKKTKGAVH